MFKVLKSVSCFNTEVKQSTFILHSCILFALLLLFLKYITQGSFWVGFTGRGLNGLFFSWDVFAPQPFDSNRAPQHFKYVPTKKNLKIELCSLLKLSSHHKIYFKFEKGNSLKAGPKAMKWTLDQTFYQKIKNEINRLIGMVWIESALGRITQLYPNPTWSKGQV